MAENGNPWREKTESLSPAARLFQTPGINCYILCIIGCKTKLNPHVIAEGLKQTLVKHPRFSSKLVEDSEGGWKKKPKWIQTEVNVKDHVMVAEIDEEGVQNDEQQFIDDYITHLTTIPLDSSKPLWEIHILNVKTSESEAIAVMRTHHSLGDGISLMSLLLACTRRTSSPEALPTVPALRHHHRESSDRRSWVSGFVLGVWSLMRLIWNTLVDIVMILATILFLKDTATPLMGGPDSERNPKRFVHKIVSLDDIKLVKNAMKMTINDVLLGVMQAALSTNLNRQYGIGRYDGERV